MPLNSLRPQPFFTSTLESCVRVGEAAGHPAQHVVKQQTLFAPEEDADAVKPFKLEEDDRESHAE
eukprot:1156000-Pelagomonas_calceolata.AAC.3